MTGTTRSSDGLDIRRRKLLFRAWHRGMREMDLIMGRFADRHIGAARATPSLTEFERLIEVPDRDLLAWITGEADVPGGLRHRVVPAAARLPTRAARARDERAWRNLPPSCSRPAAR